MAKTILESTGAQIAKIAVWDQKDTYPTISAGGETSEAVAAEAGDAIGTLNGNWIRFRDYVNALRADIAALGAVVFANQTTAGTVNTIAQYFAGFKNFKNGIGLGEANTATGFAQWFSADHAHVLQVNAPTIAADVTITLPNTTSTLATVAAIPTADGTSTALTSGVLSVKDSGVTTAKILDANVTTAKIADDAVTKAKIAADVVKGALKQDTDGALYVDVDGSTIVVANNKLVAATTINTVCISIPANTVNPLTPVYGAMPYGRVVGFHVISAAGIVTSPAAFSAGIYADNSILSAASDAGVCYVAVNGNPITASFIGVDASDPVLFQIYIKIEIPA